MFEPINSGDVDVDAALKNRRGYNQETPHINELVEESIKQLLTYDYEFRRLPNIEEQVLGSGRISRSETHAMFAPMKRVSEIELECLLGFGIPSIGPKH